MNWKSLLHSTFAYLMKERRMDIYCHFKKTMVNRKDAQMNADSSHAEKGSYPVPLSRCLSHLSLRKRGRGIRTLLFADVRKLLLQVLTLRTSLRKLLLHGVNALVEEN